MAVINDYMYVSRKVSSAFRMRCINFKYTAFITSIDTYSGLTRCPEVKRAIYHSRQN